MPPVLIKCDKCGQMVPQKNFCVRCGQELIPAKAWSDQILDPRLFSNAAKTMKDSFEKINLASVQFIVMPDDGTLPQIKPVEISSTTHAFVARSETSPLERIPAGRYPTFADLFGETGGVGQIARQSDDNTSLFVKVNCRPIMATFQLPDWQLLRGLDLVDDSGEMKSEDPNPEIRAIQRQDRAILLRKTLEQLNLLSGDNLFGGASAQLELQVVKSQEFLTALGDVMVEEGKDVEKDQLTEERRLVNNPVEKTIQVQRPPAKTAVGRMYRWVRRQVVGEKKETRVIRRTSTSKSIIYNFTLAGLYEKIRLEFRMAVQQSIKDFQAMQLLENRDEGRKAVRERIEQVMNTTLAAYGIKLNRCITFEFVCPELLTLQREKGETKIAEERLKEQAERMKLNRQATLMTREEERFDALLDFEDELKEIERDGIRAEHKDANLAAAQVRQIDRDKQLNAHNRSEALLDARQEIAVGKERALADNDVTAAKRARELAEYERYLQITGAHASQTSAQDQKELLEFLQTIAKLPPAMQQNAVAIYHAKLAATRPDLAAMLIASQQASGLEQQIAMQKEHAKELSQAHTQGTQQAVQLLAAIVQQAGNVLAANAAAKQPPQQLPPSSGKPEGDAQ